MYDIYNPNKMKKIITICSTYHVIDKYEVEDNIDTEEVWDIIREGELIYSDNILEIDATEIKIIEVEDGDTCE